MRIICLTMLAVATALSSCGDGGGSGNCGKVAPCGGDVVGNWTIEDVCVQGNLGTASCPGATADFSKLDVSGVMAYKADGKYSGTTTVSGSMKMTLPNSCLLGLSCAELSTAYLLLAAQAASPFQSASCSTAGSACSCSVVFKPNTTTQSGSYTTSGTTLVQLGNQPSSSGYCAKGNELHLTQTVPVDMGMMGAMTAGASMVLRK